MFAYFHIRAEDVSATSRPRASSAYLAIEPFKDVVSPDVTPVFMGESQVGQRLPYALRVYVRGRVQLHFTELAFHIPGLGKCRIRVFLGIGSLEKDCHGGELVTGHLREHVPEEVYRATLPLCIGIDLRGRLQEAQVLVRGEQPNALQSAFLETFQERSPTLLALARAFGRAEDFSVALAVHAYGHQHRHACHLAAPAAFQVDAVHEHVSSPTGAR